MGGLEDNIPLVALGGVGVGVLSVVRWDLEGMGRVRLDSGWVCAGCGTALGAQAGRQAYLYSLSMNLWHEFHLWKAAQAAVRAIWGHCRLISGQILTSTIGRS
jgi:hypothetical protein